MKGFFGGLLFAIGLLVAGGSGLCTVVFWGIGLAEGDTGLFFSLLPLSLLIGGVPFGVGLGCFFWGRALLRQARAERDSAVAVQAFDDQGSNSVEP